MQTPYSEVFEHFFSTVGDDLYFLLPEENSNRELTKLMNMAISGFRRPKIDLSRNNLTSLFDNELTYDEIDMIVFLMRELWLTKILMEADRFDILHKNRDYEPESQANMINAIRGLLKDIHAVKRNKLNEYTRKKGSYSGLAGKES